jgi:hypothetical protein
MVHQLLKKVARKESIVEIFELTVADDEQAKQRAKKSIYFRIWLISRD